MKRLYRRERERERKGEGVLLRVRVNASSFGSCPTHLDEKFCCFEIAVLFKKLDGSKFLKRSLL
jgi:hypothetical protein